MIFIIIGVLLGAGSEGKVTELLLCLTLWGLRDSNSGPSGLYLWAASTFTLSYYLILSFTLFVYLCQGWGSRVCRGQRPTFEHWVSPSTIGVLRVKMRSLNLAASTLRCLDTPPHLLLILGVDVVMHTYNLRAQETETGGSRVSSKFGL